MSTEGRLSERFDPILRELLAERLAVRGVGDGENQSSWVLSEAVQQRLEELEKSAADPAKVELYFGHRCATCQESVATRLVDGRYVCSACQVRPPSG